MNGTCRVPPYRASGRGRIDSGSLGVARGHACPGRGFTDTDGAQHNIHTQLPLPPFPSFPTARFTFTCISGPAPRRKGANEARNRQCLSLESSKKEVRDAFTRI